jgi:hypothetical protein
MSRQVRRARPGDAANLFVRCLLSEVSDILGGFTEEQWLKTLEYFDFKCAYTDEPVTRETAVRDHAIPINKDSCGLHLFGNVLPCRDQANQEKSFLHYHEFVTDQARLTKIESFIEQSQYRKRLAQFGDLRAYCSSQYKMITGLCESNRHYLARLVGDDMGKVRQRSDRSDPLAQPGSEIGQVPRLTNSQDVLPITLDPASNVEFKKALLETRLAWITIMYIDGNNSLHPWRAHNITLDSNIIGNLRSRPCFRAGEWQRRGIMRVCVSITRPPNE